MKSFLTSIIFIFSMQAMADGSATGFCRISNNQAHVYVCSQGAYSGSGSLTLITYSISGTSSSNHVWVAALVNRCEDVASVTVDANTLSCDVVFH